MEFDSSLNAWITFFPSFLLANNFSLHFFFTHWIQFKSSIHSIPVASNWFFVLFKICFIFWLIFNLNSTLIQHSIFLFCRVKFSPFLGFLQNFLSVWKIAFLYFRMDFSLYENKENETIFDEFRFYSCNSFASLLLLTPKVDSISTNDCFSSLSLSEDWRVERRRGQ